MKALLVLLCVVGLPTGGMGQELGRAYIPHQIPDGTPPAPAPAKPLWKVPQTDVLSAKVYAEGGRTITVREIKPIALPEPPPPREAVAPIELSAETQEKLAE